MVKCKLQNRVSIITIDWKQGVNVIAAHLIFENPNSFHITIIPKTGDQSLKPQSHYSPIAVKNVQGNFLKSPMRFVERNSYLKIPRVLEAV